MIEFETKTAGVVKIFTDDIEETALKQVYDIAENKFAENHIRIMPDVHAGKGITIGFSGLIGDYINPEHIGCDIGCNVTAEFFDRPIPIDKYEEFEHKIKKEIPMGFNINSASKVSWRDVIKFINNKLDLARVSTNGLINDIRFNCEKDISDWLKNLKMNEGTFYQSIGTGGGGNHFCEYDEFNDELNNNNDKYAIIVHCGSRNLGLKVFNYWNNIAKNRIIDKNAMRKITDDVKKNYVGDKTGIKNAINAAITEYQNNIHTGYLSGAHLKGYLTDMVICQAYAQLNHDIIHMKIRNIYNKIANGKNIGYISSMHNYIDFDCETPIVRKGAVRANKDEIFILPFNMRDGVAICNGKGNEDWNFTAPHGAGRKMSRSAAKAALNVEDFQNTMADAGIYTTTANISTLDEAPDAYKPKSEIIENIKDTCDILYFMKPKINIKAAE